MDSSTVVCQIVSIWLQYGLKFTLLTFVLQKASKTDQLKFVGMRKIREKTLSEGRFI